MESGVRISELIRVLLPRNYPNGWLGVLTAYFDDSGTHTGGIRGPSTVVVVGGLVGTEAQLDALDRAWKSNLDRPVDGRRDRLKRFHMADSQILEGEFANWSRTESEYFCRTLQDAIIASGVFMYAVGVERQAWDELVQGDMRGYLGDAEGFCISQCILKAVEFASQDSPNPKLTFVFDNRTPEVCRRGQAVGDAFKQTLDYVLNSPEIIGTAFLNSAEIRPLQAADMIAWEFYQYAQDFIAGKAGVLTPLRPQMQRFQETQRVHAQMARRKEIAQIVEEISARVPADQLAAVAQHSRTFDPSSPDYSYLSTKKSS